MLVPTLKRLIIVFIALQVDDKTDETEDEHDINLGSLLQSMDVEIRKLGDDFTGNEEQFLEYLHMAINSRKKKDESHQEFSEKLLKEKDRFVELIKKRMGKDLDHVLKHTGVPK